MAYTFKRHMQIHEAISIGYDCPVCGLRREENHVCVFNCSYCDNSFSSKFNLLVHRKLHVGINLVKKTICSDSDVSLVENELLVFQ